MSRFLPFNGFLDPRKLIRPISQKYLTELCPYERKKRKEFLSDLYLKSLSVEPINGSTTYFPRSTSFNITPKPAEVGYWQTATKSVASDWRFSCTERVLGYMHLD